MELYWTTDAWSYFVRNIRKFTPELLNKLIKRTKGKLTAFDMILILGEEELGKENK